MKPIKNWFAKDIAVDLGSANTLVFTQEGGIIINEPSVVAVQKDAKGQTKILNIGTEAKRMLERTPDHIDAIRPIRNGVIEDFEVTQSMLRHFLWKAWPRNRFFRPRVMISIPRGTTPVEKRAVRESTESAGAGQVFMIEESMAAAIGAGLPVAEPSGNMVVDIGGGTTEVAIISLGGVVYSQSVRVAGDRFNEVIAAHVKNEHSLLIGERTAEIVKIAVGSAWQMDPERTFEVKGRDAVTGSPKTSHVTSEEIRSALSKPVDLIIDTIQAALERTPPELSGDIVDNGIILTGGGALLSNLDIAIRERTGLPVAVANDPLTCVVRGAGQALEDRMLLQQVVRLSG